MAWFAEKTLCYVIRKCWIFKKEGLLKRLHHFAALMPSKNLADPGPDLVPSFQSLVNDLSNVLEKLGKKDEREVENRWMKS